MLIAITLRIELNLSQRNALRIQNTSMCKYLIQ